MQAAGNMNLSIIVISYNTKEITKNCLDSISESLKGSSINYEVIIVDNASNDGTVNKIKNLKLKIRNLNLIQNNKNIGFAKANNQAVKQSKGNYLLFLNSDIVVKFAGENINTKNIHHLLSGYDLILDCTDNLKTKFLLNSYCLSEKKVFVFVGIEFILGVG